MIYFPNAKVNLGLRVTSKRQDGYHALDTVFFPVPLHDVLEVITQSSPSTEAVTFTHSGIPIPGDESSNLCIKAYNLLKKTTPNSPPFFFTCTSIFQWVLGWAAAQLTVHSC